MKSIPLVADALTQLDDTFRGGHPHVLRALARVMDVRAASTRTSTRAERAGK